MTLIIKIIFYTKYLLSKNMKKLISLFIALATFAIGCMPTAMAGFMVDEVKMSDNMNMQHESMMTSEDCCDSMSSGCDETSHECCLSPFNDSNITWNVLSQKEDKKIKFKTFWVDILAIINNSLEYNYIERLNSPPEIWDLENQENLYTSLTWIVKSNC